MFCSILSAAIYGVDAVPIWVEADVSSGMPVFSMVGFVSSQVKEAQDRVRTALKNIGIILPPKRVTVNLAFKRMTFYLFQNDSPNLFKDFLLTFSIRNF